MEIFLSTSCTRRGSITLVTNHKYCLGPTFLDHARVNAKYVCDIGLSLHLSPLAQRIQFYASIQRGSNSATAEHTLFLHSSDTGPRADKRKNTGWLAVFCHCTASTPFGGLFPSPWSQLTILGDFLSLFCFVCFWLNIKKYFSQNCHLHSMSMGGGFQHAMCT